MALIKCKECGAEVSSKAKTCPKCGVKVEKKTSIVTWLVLGLVVYVAYIAVQSPAPTHASRETIIDVTKIAGKSEKEVSAYLGQPLSCGDSKFGEKCHFQKGETEIIFIDEKADWITVQGAEQIPFSMSALSAIGLQVQQPSFRSDFVLRWRSIQGLMEVSIFKGASNIDYFYIKVRTK